MTWQVRNDPLSWPTRIADGVCKSLVSLAPKNADDPLNVKCDACMSSQREPLL